MREGFEGAIFEEFGGFVAFDFVAFLASDPVEADRVAHSRSLHAEASKTSATASDCERRRRK